MLQQNLMSLINDIPYLTHMPEYRLMFEEIARELSSPDESLLDSLAESFVTE